MEQMYLIEIFIEKVSIFQSEDDESSSRNKNLIIKIKFGPKVQFIVKEAQLAVNNEKQEDIIECDDTGRRKWTRTIRVGKSYLFPAYPDTILLILSKFPLEIEVWNDDENEPEHKLFIGVGNMHWDTHFFHMVKETADPCKIHQPLSIKTKTAIWAECCCVQAGEIFFILRLSALGDTITTEFQQLLNDPDSFVFRTNKAPSMFQCKKIDGDDPNFCMVGSLYETTTLEDPDLLDAAQRKIEVCTEMQSCGVGGVGEKYVCEHGGEETAVPSRKYPISKIRMGDITGPCGNTNCALAHKVRKYIRNLETYKGKATAAGISDVKSDKSRKICGKCICKADRYHRDDCPETTENRIKCSGCGGMVKSGHTCEQLRNKVFGTGVTPRTSDTQVTYVLSVTKFPRYTQGMFGHDTIVEDCYCMKRNSQDSINNQASNSLTTSQSEGCCHRPSYSKSVEPFVYNVDTNNAKLYGARISNVVSTSTGTNTNPGYNTNTRRNVQIYNLEISEEKDCRCTPIKPSPPCRTFDCDCLAETENMAARKAHKPYCPSYRHKENCPVTMMHVEEEQKKLEDEEDEAAPLPYGLPPIQLGPCPVMGRPCTVPDGFARMYKNAQQPTQPFSYSDSGKVCCSKEYERIKKAIIEYTKNEKEDDFRCVNKFNVDTERRCCDKEQVLRALIGKSCCGSHKIAIQDKYPVPEKKKEP